MQAHTVTATQGSDAKQSGPGHHETPMPRASDVLSSSAVGVRDIAQRLGVSVGTVDRALHDKRDIKPETRARVLAEAEKLGYKPNLAARYLRSRRQMQIAVQLPETSSFFWETLRDGMREAAASMAPSPELVFRTYAGAWTPDRVLPERGLDRYSSGLIVAPGDTTAIATQLEDLSKRNVPVAYVASDIPNSLRLLSVSVDPLTVGALAGELVGRFVPSGGKVAVVTSSTRTRDHAEQMRGFASSLSMIGARVKLAAVVESQADERETRRRIRELLHAHPRLKGLYISTSDALPVLRAVGHEGRLATLAVVATDLTSELIPWIRSGKVAATIYQRPLTQGHMVLQLLYQYLESRVLPTSRRQAVAPYAVMNSNLDIVLQRLAIARASTVSTEPAPSVSAL